MKSKNFLSNLWSLLVGSQRNDVEFDRRLTVGSPSGFTINWTLKLVSVLVLVLTIGIGNAWGTDTWVLVEDYSTLSTSDTFVIAGNIKGGSSWYALKNNQVTSNTNLPTASSTALTISSKKITSTINGDYTWVLQSTGTSEEWYIKSTKGTYYLQNDGNTGSKITSKSATDGQNKWKIHYKQTSGDNTVTGLYNVGVSRELGCYNSTTWRCYTSSNYANLAGAEVVLYKKASPYTVRFYTASGVYEDIEEASAGAGVTPPSMTTPCGDWAFQGWSTSYSNSSTSTTVLSTVTLTAGKYYPGANTTLYPVYTKSGEGDVEVEITIESFSGLGSNNYSSGAERTGSAGGASFGGHYITGNAVNSPASGEAAGTYIQCQGNNANIYNKTAFSGYIKKVVLNQYGAQSFTLYCGTSQLMGSDNTKTGQTPSGTAQTAQSAATQMTWNVSTASKYTFLDIKKNTGAAYVTSIVITYLGTITNYYSYPSCVSCDGPSVLTKGSFNSSTHKQPINWTSAAGKVDICYSTSSTKPGSTPGSGYTVIEGLTGSTSTSNTYNLDVSGFAPGNYYVWARSVCSESAKSDWVAMTSNYFTLTGYTLTLSKSGGGTSSTVTGDPTWTSVVPGNQVSVTATPASGYTFTSWSVSGTSSTLSSTTTNPTTFTMGTANSTVTATFSQIYVTSLKLRAQQTDQSDKTGSDLTMTCYPKEGQTGGNDPLNHTLNVAFNEVLPSTALDKTYDWSVRVKAKGDADWTAVSFTDNALNTNTIINSYNKSTGNLQIKATEGTAEIKITAHDGSGVTAKVTITVSNVAMSSVSVDPTEMTVYAGQKKAVAVTFTPANATDRSYSAGSSYSFVNIQNRAAASFNIEGKTSVTAETKNETVTVTTTDGGKTATVAVTIKPLPLVHFVDIIHNETFADVVATTDGTTVTFAKTVPTHDDLDVPGSGNDCEKEHLHLIGWIRSDYTKVANYMNGTGDAPTNAEITGAGTGYYYAAGADITLTDDMHGKTFYAVWAKVE